MGLVGARGGENKLSCPVYLSRLHLYNVALPYTGSTIACCVCDLVANGRM